MASETVRRKGNTLIEVVIALMIIGLVGSGLSTLCHVISRLKTFEFEQVRYHQIDQACQKFERVNSHCSIERVEPTILRLSHDLLYEHKGNLIEKTRMDGYIYWLRHMKSIRFREIKSNNVEIIFSFYNDKR